MVATKQDANRLISEMPDNQFSILCTIMNTLFVENDSEESRAAATAEFLRRMQNTKDAVARGEFVTSMELHEFLGV